MERSKIILDTREIRQQLFAGVVLCLLGGLLFWLYSHAKGMMWGFDDSINLKGLSELSDFESLVDYLTSGMAGPTGRPLSLLAFVPNYADWQNNPIGFVYGSLLWHCMNALLVFSLARRLLSLNYSLRDSFWMAMFVAVLWALLPIHASSLLLPVQRMTHVSAFFSLLALNLYVFWRAAGRKGLLEFVVAVLVFLGLMVASIFSKENGVLTIAFAALIEIVIFRSASPPFNQKIWNGLVWLGFLLVPGFLLWKLFGYLDVIISGTVWRREFNYMERLATEPVILWEYLRMILFPRVSYLGPYHDGHEIYRWGDLLPWIAIGAWVATIAAAYKFMRSGSHLGRMFFFAVAFFLVGHQLESSIILLELYFEHRNYLPALGIALFVVTALKESLSVMESKVLPWLIFGLFLAFNVFSVQQVSSIWGQPLAAAELWYKVHPNSTRALQLLASQYARHGFIDAALRELDEFVEDEEGKKVGAVAISMQSFVIACRLESDEQLKNRLSNISKRMEGLARPYSVAAILPGMGNSIREGECGGVDVHSFRGLLSSMLALPRIKNTPKVAHHVNHELALISKVEDDFVSYVEYMKGAFRAYPTLSVAQKIAADYFQQGQDKNAISWVEEALNHAPGGLSGVFWKRSLSSLREALLEVQSMRAEQAESLSD